MDSYVSKPIRIKEVEKVLSQLLSGLHPARAHGSVMDQEHDVIDQAAVLAGVAGNRPLLRQLVRLFLADYPQRLAEIKQAIRHGDAAELARAAHALKGSIGNFAARKAFAAAAQLESIGRHGSLDAASEACATLESELAFLSEKLRTLTMTSAKGRTKKDGDDPRKQKRM